MGGLGETAKGVICSLCGSFPHPPSNSFINLTGALELSKRYFGMENTEKTTLCGIENVPSAFALMFNKAKDYVDDEGGHPLFERVDKVTEYAALKSRAKHETFGKSDFTKFYDGVTKVGSAAGIIKTLWAMGKEEFEKQTTFVPKKGESSNGVKCIEYVAANKKILLSTYALNTIRETLKIGRTQKCTLAFEWVEFLNDKGKKVVTTLLSLGRDRATEMAASELDVDLTKLSDDQIVQITDEWIAKHTFGKVISTNDKELSVELDNPLCSWRYLKKARQIEYCYDPYQVVDILRKWASCNFLEQIAKHNAEEKVAKKGGNK